MLQLYLFPVYNKLVMAKRKRKKKTKKEVNIKSNETIIVIGLIVTTIGLAVTVSPFLDATIFRFFKKILGYASIPWGLTLLCLGVRLLSNHKFFRSWRFLIGLALFSITTNIFLLSLLPSEDLLLEINFSTSGGTLGKLIHTQLYSILGQLFEFIIIILGYLVSSSLISGAKLTEIRDFILGFLDSKDSTAKKDNKKVKRQNEEDYFPEQSEENDNDNFLTNLLGMGDGNKASLTEQDADIYKTKNRENPNDQKDETSKESNDTDTEEKDNNDKKNDDKSKDSNTDENINMPNFPDWETPPLSLLQDPSIRPQNREVLKKKVAIIEQTLASFNVDSEVQKIVPGPTVVQYALSITTGTKVNKVRNLKNDLALALAVAESSIRIEAPIPGTSLIGIEIPNPTPNFVYAKELIAKLKEQHTKYNLPLILGKSVSNKHIIKDLTKLPHLLVAGATGTGKSVGINAMLIGMLFTKSPDELKLILIDPKMVEMSPYNGIPHLLTPVITDMELVINALQWAIEEMQRRYRMLKQAKVRNLSEFNKKHGYPAMPYIVIAIDEMADLMLSTGVDVESRIVRLAQMSRAVGIHLILATQRPSVDVLTGLIKANVPGRIAFSVATAIDSRVIIDQAGAESLIGQGDMLFKSPALSRPIRIQGTFTDIKDLESVIQFTKKQGDDQNKYNKAIVEDSKKRAKENGSIEAMSDDELFEDAVKVVIADGKASSSYLQRKLRIGYNRAARLIDEMEGMGIVSSRRGNQKRKVLISSIDQLRKK